MPGAIREAFDRFQSRLGRTEQIYIVIIAIVIGLLGGLGAVAFRRFILFVQNSLWQSETLTLDYLRSLPAWWKIAVPAGGGLIVGFIIHRFAREAKGHGVPEVMEAVALHGGRIRPRVVIAKLIASGISIGSGGSVGREGPIVQIGSSIGSAIGQWLHVGERRLRTLVGCGAAAGIAGTFNAPIAGALFAVEVILGDFGVSRLSPIVISSVTATVVAQHFLGDVPAFDVPAYHLVHPAELFAYAALGILAGLVSIAFVRTLYATEDLFDRLPGPAPGKALFGGAIIGLIGLRYPEIFGVGYEAIDESLHAGMVWHLLLILAVVKIAAVSITIGSGGSGGVFAPSLFIGAMTGGAVGSLAHSLWPASTASAGAYALVGMGGVVAATTHAPITAIVIIFELTGDYNIILPLMITCIIATLLSTELHKASIYTLKLLRRGIDIRAGKSVNVLRHLKVRDIARADYSVVPPDEPLISVFARISENPTGSVFVVGGGGRLLGVITMNEVRPIMTDTHSLDTLLIAGDFMRTDEHPLFRLDDSLDIVMRRFGSYRFEAAVVDGDKIIGSVRPEDVIRRYSGEVFKQDMAASMSLSMTDTFSAESIPGVSGMSIGEVTAPRSFAGRSVADLQIRKKFGVVILLIKRSSDGKEEVVNQLPDAEYVIREGDRLLLMGPDDDLKRIERSG